MMNTPREYAAPRRRLTVSGKTVASLLMLIALWCLFEGTVRPAPKPHVQQTSFKD